MASAVFEARHLPTLCTTTVSGHHEVGDLVRSEFGYFVLDRWRHTLAKSFLSVVIDALKSQTLSVAFLIILSSSSMWA